MPPNDRNKLNRIEELKNKLFSKSFQTKLEHRDIFTHKDGKSDVSDSWETGGGVETERNENFFLKTSIFKNFFVFSIAFFILTLGYASYVIFFGDNTVSNDNIEISILGNTFTAGGDELSFVVGVTNRNSLPLDLVDLVIEYPKNAESDASLGTERLRESLGTIPAGAVRNENMKIVLFGQQGSIIPVKISIEYRVEGSNAIFVKEKIHDVTINSTPLNLSLDAPSTISPNQTINLVVKATLNATKIAPDMLLKLDYPVGFQFTSSVPPPTFSNNTWDLGDLAGGAEYNVSITGRMLDVFDGEEKIFRAYSGSQSATNKSAIDVVFNTLAHAVKVQKPFIETKFYVNGSYQREYAVDSVSKINGEIFWTNNLDTQVNDLEIHAKVSGNAVSRKTINAERGFYNSLEDVLIWDKNSQNDFKEIDPGDSGSVSFSMSPLPLFSAENGLLPNPSINVEISITGKQSLVGYATEELENFESTTIKIISDVSFTPKVLYSTGPFINKGPLPPQAEKETTYTIMWTLSNTSNNISNGVLRSSIPSWVRFVGPVSPANEDLTYNASTREIIWRVGKIPKGTSVTVESRSAAFQVAFTPSLSQIGTIPVIVNSSTLTGRDDFANVDVRVNKASLRSTLSDGDESSSGAVRE